MRRGGASKQQSSSFADWLVTHSGGLISNTRQAYAAVIVFSFIVILGSVIFVAVYSSDDPYELTPEEQERIREDS